MKKIRHIFISFMVIYVTLMFFTVKYIMDIGNEHVFGPQDQHSKWIDRETFKRIDDVSVKLGINDKYNWSFTGQMNQDYGQFAPAMSIAEHTRYIDLITVFKSACESFNVTYMLGAGTLLGAHWFHGFIPWDDDFDCVVNVSQKYILKKALTEISGHTLLSPKYRQWKFFSNNFSKAGSYGWNWPFVDIFFFTDNKTHVYHVTYNTTLIFDPRSDVLPLNNGIFENLIVPVPRNMEAYLKRRYSLTQPCLSNWWNHKTETRPKINSSSIPCHKLFGVYPLVHRLKLGNTSFEELRLGNKVLYRVERPSMKVSI